MTGTTERPRATPIAELKTAFHKLVAAAFRRDGERVESFASIPARPGVDADLLVADALDELAHLRDSRAALVEALKDIANYKCHCDGNGAPCGCGERLIDIAEQALAALALAEAS
jgi:hypothetical protein